MDSFQRLLQEKHYPVDKEVLRQRIDELRQKLKLEHFEKQLNNSQHQPLTIYDLDSATGYEFENFLNILFKKMGYKVENTKLSGDQGADLVVEKFGEKIVVQAKRYNNKVTNRGVQEVVAAIKHYKADKGMVITTNEFTRSAIKLASSNNIKLIDRGELSKLISTYL
ncbi:MAG: restriction endonuclease [Candidatus Omnitrophica bacterium]|nr:restriction endonuclease [Candidatus Omnitrophota bacterium]